MSVDFKTEIASLRRLVAHYKGIHELTIRNYRALADELRAEADRLRRNQLLHAAADRIRLQASAILATEAREAEDLENDKAIYERGRRD
jgi:hypothetical protein